MDGTLPGSHGVADRPAVQETTRRGVRLSWPYPRGVRSTQIALLLTVLVPMLMLQAAVYYSWFQTHRDAELESNLELARAVASTFEAHVQDVLHQELTIGLALTSHGNLPIEQGKILTESISQYPAIRSYNWLSPQGQILASTDSSIAGSNLSSRPYFLEIVRGREWVVSDMLPDLSSGDPIIAVARAARDENGALRGVVLATVDPALLGSAVVIQRTGKASFGLFDRQGMLVYRSPETPSWDERERIGHDPSVLKALAGEESTALVAGPGGKGRFAARVPIPSIGWAAGASRSANEVMGPVATELATYAGLSLLVSLAATVAALAVGRRLTGPLDRLRAHAVAIGEGDFGRAVEASGPAELVDLAVAFDRMSKEVRIREENLRKSGEGLRFLADASNVLAASLDYETTLTSIAHLSVPRIADWCVVDLPAEDDAPRRVAAVHVDPVCQGTLRGLIAHPIGSANPDDPVTRVLRSGRPELVADVPDELLVQIAGEEKLVASYRVLGLVSLMVVPLVVRGRTFGTILFASGKSGRRYDAEDLALVELLARRAALAMDNSKLYGEVQESVRMRDEFFSVAAHELKTPITSLRGFAQLAVRQLDKAGELDPVRARQALQVIDEQSRKLSNLVTQLLDVSRLEAGRLSLRKVTIDLVSLVESVVQATRTSAGPLALTLRAPSPVSASVDSLRLEQVVTNLIDNAIKYSPDGGEIEVTVNAPDEDTARIIVRDHGVGIPREKRSRIFDRFYQAHSESYYGGMGLGLYISREIVILHGGKIEVEFPEDGGTRFVVSLPREIEDGAADSLDVAELL